MNVNDHLPSGIHADKARSTALTELANGMQGSRILAIAGEVRGAIARGQTICNLTVGDFSPDQFGVPPALQQRISEEVAAGNNNYPPADGLPELRQAICDLYDRRLGVRFSPEAVVVGSGARPPIFAAFNLVLEPGDKVLYGVPSWNVEYYVHLNRAQGIAIVTGPEDNFHLTAEALATHLPTARLLVINSPLNPTGTCITEQALKGICDAVLAENKSREAAGRRPLMLLFDQVYWLLTYGHEKHHHPLAVCPDLAPYTFYVDAISKWFASTGLRVGWGVVPPYLQPRFKALIGHMGAWAPRPVQAATTWYLGQEDRIAPWLDGFKDALQARLDCLYNAFTDLARAGYPVEATAPQGAIYLTVRLDLVGRTDPHGAAFETNEDIRRFLLRDAGIALVPFQAFGMGGETGWFRASIGAVGLAELRAAMDRLGEALGKIS
jgi:aspartate aminotransferase